MTKSPHLRSSLLCLLFAGLVTATGCGDDQRSPSAPTAALPDPADLPAMAPGWLQHFHETDVVIHFDGTMPWLPAGVQVLEVFEDIGSAEIRSPYLNSWFLKFAALGFPGVQASDGDPMVDLIEGHGMSVSFNDGLLGMSVSFNDGEKSHSDFVDQEFVTRLNVAASHVAAKGAGVTVAIVDTGVDPNHPELAGRIVGGRDLVDNDNDPSDVPNGTDDDGDGMVDEGFGHGTHMASLVAMLAPEADLLVYRVLDADGQGYASDVAKAIRRARQAGADIISLSLGTFDLPKILEKQLERASDEGVLIVASVGNEGTSAAPQYPAAFPSTLGVGSVNEFDEFSIFSSFGPELDLVAPGENILAAHPDGGYSIWTGTSVAAPIVSAAAAVLLSGGSLGEPTDAAEWLIGSGVPVSGLPTGVSATRVDFTAAQAAAAGTP